MTAGMAMGQGGGGGWEQPGLSRTEFNALEARVTALEYVSPTVTLSGGSAYVKGQTVANPALTFTLNKTMTARNLTGAVTTNLGAGTSGTYTDTGRNLDMNSATKTYTMVVSDGTASATNTTTYSWTNRRYVGQSTNTVWDNAEIIALTASTQAKGASGTQLDMVGEYVVVAYPLSLGLCSSFTIAGFPDSNLIVSTNSVTNAYGYAENYLVYRNENALTAGSVIYVLQ
jgi:hypothetical protein